MTQPVRSSLISAVPASPSVRDAVRRPSGWVSVSPPASSSLISAVPVSPCLLPLRHLRLQQNISLLPVREEAPGPSGATVWLLLRGPALPGNSVGDTARLRPGLRSGGGTRGSSRGSRDNLLLRSQSRGTTGNFSSGTDWWLAGAETSRVTKTVLRIVLYCIESVKIQFECLVFIPEHRFFTLHAPVDVLCQLSMTTFFHEGIPPCLMFIPEIFI